MQWIDAIRQQAITWAYVDPVLYHHIASLARNELKQNRPLDFYKLPLAQFTNMV